MAHKKKNVQPKYKRYDAEKWHKWAEAWKQVDDFCMLLEEQGINQEDVLRIRMAAPHIWPELFK